jgi:hypothetical protein
MEDLTDNFEKLTDQEFVMEAGVVFATFAGLEMTAPMLDGVLPVDVPNEAYGAGAVVAAEMGDIPYKRSVQLGGGVYTVDQLASRFNVRSRFQGVLA